VKKSPEARGKNSDGAGATPPFDAPCVTVAVGSLPPRSRLLPGLVWPRAGVREKLLHSTRHYHLSREETQIVNSEGTTQTVQECKASATT